MGIPQLSKYIIIFLFAVLVVLSVMLGIYSAENKMLTKDNTRLKEKVLLQEAAIKEIDINIELLKNQVQEAESICEDRLKARNDLLVFLKNEPFKDTDKKQIYIPPLNMILHDGSQKDWKGLQTPAPFQLPRLQGQVPQKCDSATLGYNKNKYKVVSDEKSVVAIDYINDYWRMFTTHTDNSEK